MLRIQKKKDSKILTLHRFHHLRIVPDVSIFSVKWLNRSSKQEGMSFEAKWRQPWLRGLFLPKTDKAFTLENNYTS